MKKLFTLIELIVVIIVLGILAAIVIPNISNMKQEATSTAIKSNVRNIQTSVDMYSLDYNGDMPSVVKASPMNPSRIDFDKIEPNYLRKSPEQSKFKYWIDYSGKVWASTIDSPQGVNFSANTLKWQSVEEAQKYNIYEVENYTSVTSSLYDKTKLNLVKEVNEFTVVNNEIVISNINNGAYAVSAIDENGFESAPAGIEYKGYSDSITIPEAIDKFTPFTPSTVSEEHILSTNINTEFEIEIDSKGNRHIFWVNSTTKYLYHKVVDPNDIVIKPVTLLMQNVGSISMDGTMKSIDATFDENDNFYLIYSIPGRYEKFIQKFDRDGAKVGIAYQMLKGSYDWPSQNHSIDYEDGYLYVVISDGWSSNENTYLYKLDTEYKEVFTRKALNVKDVGESIVFVKNDKVYISLINAYTGTSGAFYEQLYIYSADNGTLIKKKEVPHNKKRVSSIALDGNNNLWYTSAPLVNGYYKLTTQQLDDNLNVVSSHLIVSNSSASSTMITMEDGKIAIFYPYQKIVKYKYLEK